MFLSRLRFAGLDRLTWGASPMKRALVTSLCVAALGLALVCSQVVVAQRRPGAAPPRAHQQGSRTMYCSYQDKYEGAILQVTQTGSRIMAKPLAGGNHLMEIILVDPGFAEGDPSSRTARPAGILF